MRWGRVQSRGNSQRCGGTAYLQPSGFPCSSRAPAAWPSLLCALCRTSDAAARERLGALPVFVMALQASGWSGREGKGRSLALHAS